MFGDDEDAEDCLVWDLLDPMLTVETVVTVDRIWQSVRHRRSYISRYHGGFGVVVSVYPPSVYATVFPS